MLDLRIGHAIILIHYPIDLLFIKEDGKSFLS